MSNGMRAGRVLQSLQVSGLSNRTRGLGEERERGLCHGDEEPEEPAGHPRKVASAKARSREAGSRGIKLVKSVRAARAMGRVKTVQGPGQLPPRLKTIQEPGDRQRPAEEWPEKGRKSSSSVASESPEGGSGRDRAGVSTHTGSHHKNVGGCSHNYDSSVFPTEASLRAARGHLVPWGGVPLPSPQDRAEFLRHANVAFCFVTDFFPHYVCSQVFEPNDIPGSVGSSRTVRAS